MFLCEQRKCNKQAYNRQRNFCVGLVSKAKTWFSENVNVNCTIDNKIFWAVVIFSYKSTKNEKITLVEEIK